MRVGFVERGNRRKIEILILHDIEGPFVRVRAEWVFAIGEEEMGNETIWENVDTKGKAGMRLIGFRSSIAISSCTNGCGSGSRSTGRDLFTETEIG